MEPTTTAKAHKLKLKAQRKRQIVEDCQNRDAGRDLMDLMLADEMDASASDSLVLQEIPKRGTGGELMPPNDGNNEGMAMAVEHPTLVSLNASLDRVDLADQCGVFDMALDAAQTIKAENAMEQMLAHQMTAAHKMSMKLMAKAFNEKHNIEITRLVSTSARLMDVYSKAMLTLNKIRTGGEQIVTVQHVNVNDGGQAVINPLVRAPARGRVGVENPGSEDKK